MLYSIDSIQVYLLTKPTTLYIHEQQLINTWLGDTVISTSHLLSCIQFPVMTLPGYFWDRRPSLAGKLSWDITSTHVNSALHPSGSLNRVPASDGVNVKSHCCQVADNTIWCHMACDFPWQWGDFDYGLLYSYLYLYEFKVPLDTIQVISETVFPDNHLTATSKTEPNYDINT